MTSSESQKPPLARIATTLGPNPLATVGEQFITCWHCGYEPPWPLLMAIVGTLNELVDAENARRLAPQSDPTPSPEARR